MTEKMIFFSDIKKYSAKYKIVTPSGVRKIVRIDNTEKYNAIMFSQGENGETETQLTWIDWDTIVFEIGENENEKI